MVANILLGFLCIFIIIYILLKFNDNMNKEKFINKYINKEAFSSINNKEGFVSNQCPTTMIKKGNQIILYNPKLAKVPGVNPITLSSLEDYKEYIKWQRASNINCPILHLEKMYDTQGNENYEIKQSFMLDQPSGPLNHELPIINKRPSMDQLLNAHYDTNVEYNKNSFPAFDPYNQNVGSTTQHDSDGSNPQLQLPFR